MSPSATSDPTATFFDDLGERGHEANLVRLTGTVRFDLARRNRTDSWLVAIRKGDVAVSREPAEADCVVSTAKGVFDALVTGEPSEPVMGEAREYGVHFLAGGHYATETMGIRRLGELVAERFGIEHEFIDVPNPI